MLKRFQVSLILAGLILLMANTAFAWPGYFEGRPDELKFDHSHGHFGRPDNFKLGHGGYFIWHDDDGIHLLATTKGREHNFSGVIITEGEFTDVERQRAENNDTIKVGGWNKVIKFDFKTKDGSDGVKFRVADGRYVHFKLFIDGREVKDDEIYLGRHGRHPDDNSFTIMR